MNPQIEKIQQVIEPLRQEIIHHKVYSAIKDIEDLKVFMQYHAYAVWDFMSLLKSLQNHLTCTTVPWFPKGSGETRHLINEIVAGEESDLNLEGERKSHYELYLDAMKQCSADTSSIEKFIQELKKSSSFPKAYEVAETPKEVRSFVDYTFEIIESHKPHILSAVFTFGREDLIPDMFLSIIQEIHKTFPEEISIFKYYIKRHIEVDGDHHSHLALQMTTNLCENNALFWKEAEEATILSLQKRKLLWDGVYHELIRKQEAVAQC